MSTEKTNPNINCIGYYETVPFQPGTLRSALEGMEDGDGSGAFLSNVYFDRDDHNTVYVDFYTVGPYGTPQSKHFFRFAWEDGSDYNGLPSLAIDETFDAGETWEWFSEPESPRGCYVLDLDDAAEFIRDWVVTA